MRSASHFAGVFKGYTYIHINSFDKEVTQKTFKEQEAIILKKIIEQQLDVYDYQGISLLPSLSQEIQALCQKGINYYNLETSYIDLSASYEEKAVPAMQLIYSNMIACYKRGGYSDVVGRIFRMEEAIGQLLFYRWLKREGKIQKEGIIVLKDIKKRGYKNLEFAVSFESVIEKKPFKEIILEEYPHSVWVFYENIEKGRTEIVFKHKNQKEVPITVVANGKNYYYFLFRSLQLHKEIYDFWEKINDFYPHPKNPLNLLRNQSILGHGMEGVSKEDLERVILQPFEEFTQELEHLMKIHAQVELKNLFDEINTEILENLA